MAVLAYAVFVTTELSLGLVAAGLRAVRWVGNAREDLLAVRASVAGDGRGGAGD